MAADPASISPENIYTIGAFATVVVGMGFFAFRWLTRQHAQERKQDLDNFQSKFEEMNKKSTNALDRSTDALEHVASSQRELAAGVNALTAKSKTEADFATLLLKVLEQKDQTPKHKDQTT